VLDFATSHVATGKVRVANNKRLAVQSRAAALPALTQGVTGMLRAHSTIFTGGLGNTAIATRSLVLHS
jgi:hypothetical protein